MGHNKQNRASISNISYYFSQSTYTSTLHITFLVYTLYILYVYDTDIYIAVSCMYAIIIG